VEEHMSDKTFCCLPWVHLASHPHGGVTLCCVSDHSHSMNRARNFTENGTDYLSLNSDSLTDIMNSDYFKDTRLKMLAGKEVSACHRCFKEEANGIRSKRLEENARLGFTFEDAQALTSTDGFIEPDFKFIELRLGNLCNVRCRTCNPASSTSWATEYQKLQANLKFVTTYDSKMDASWTESDSFWDDLLLKSNSLELLYINGGEPTLVEKHWTHYLQRLIDVGLNKQITLWYNINMTNLPDKLIELWSQFKSVKISCSIDDLDDRNEYLRTGTKWKDVITNLDKLQSYKWIDVSICQTVSWMNLPTLTEFHAFMAARNLHVHMNFVHDPKFLSISAVPKDDALAQVKLLTLEPWKMNALMNMIREDNDRTLIEQGKDYMSWLDKSRGNK
jgi:sulfatase maturation enzyme AslB (radical SAM superfamily)